MKNQTLYTKMKRDAHSRVLKNRDSISTALKNLEITSVVINYSGSGDCGGIDEVSLYKGDELVEMNGEVLISTETSSWDSKKSIWINQTIEKICSLKEALETFLYDWLECKYSGWEINDGSSGECTISVATNKFLLNHTTYYTESETTEHSL